jgi:hypothetical protein
MNASEMEKVRKRWERLAWLTDNSIPVPGINAKVAIDPLIRLILWFGDTLGFLLFSILLPRLRNVRLLEHYIQRPHKTVVASRLFVAFLALAADRVGNVHRFAGIFAGSLVVDGG